MQLGSLYLVGEELLDKYLDRGVISTAGTVKTDEACSLNQRGLAQNAGFDRLSLKEHCRARDSPGRNRLGKWIDNRDGFLRRTDLFRSTC